MKWTLTELEKFEEVLNTTFQKFTREELIYLNTVLRAGLCDYVSDYCDFYLNKHNNCNGCKYEKACIFLEVVFTSCITAIEKKK